MANRFVALPARGKIMGVAAGLSDFTGVDVLIIRLALVLAALFTGPVAVVLYLVTGWLASADR